MPLANEPPRRPQRRTHLDASVVPVERALIARAEALSQEVLDEPESPGATEEQAMTEGVTRAVRAFIARESLALAEELHWH